MKLLNIFKTTKSRKHTEATKRKISETQKKNWAERKGNTISINRGGKQIAVGIRKDDDKGFMSAAQMWGKTN